MHLLYLDRYHLDDRLFLQAMARSLSQPAVQRGSWMVLHGSGEGAERLLEAEGLIPERHAGVLAAENAGAAVLIERGIRESNKNVVALLTDGGVSAVGLQGTDRGLLQSMPDEGLQAQRASWLAEMAGKRIVPVLSALVPSQAGQQAEEAPLVEVALAVAKSMERERVTVVFFTRDNRPGLYLNKEVQAFWKAAEVPEECIFPSADPVRRVAAEGLAVLLTNASGLGAGPAPAGTQVVA